MAVRCGSMLVSWVVILFVLCGQAAAQPRPVPGRPDIYEIGDPFPISRPTLASEMRRNDDLRLYISEYGWPDYAEVQEVLPLWPWADYEVRLYYLDRDLALAYGRYFIAPAFQSFGSRKSTGHIPPETLRRLLTAQPISGRGAQPIPPSAPEGYFPPRAPGPSEEEMESGRPVMPPVNQSVESNADLQLQTHAGRAVEGPVLAQQSPND